jgi:hypothetical protein
MPAHWLANWLAKTNLERDAFEAPTSAAAALPMGCSNPAATPAAS